MLANTSYMDSPIMPNLDSNYRDKTSPVWDMSQERALMEQIVSQRVHFYLILHSILLAAAVNARHQIQLQVLLTVGAALSIVMTLAFSRVIARLDVTLRLLSKDDSHPFSIVNSELNKVENGRPPVRGLFWLGSVVILIAAAGAWVNLLQVPK